MASEEQLKLANFIKTVHLNLRTNAKLFGADKAWSLHCQETNVLKQYSNCMKKLATEYWEKENNTTISNSRITWVVTQSIQYINEGVQYQRKREYDILEKLNLNKKINCEIKEMSLSTVRLLDVGSCYNPFKNYFSEVVAIDLYSENREVKICDFLNLKCVDYKLPTKNVDEIKQLTKEFFDIVVFSLFLEYLPSSEQRVLSCKKAYELLKYEGILIIVTPDSKHAGANSALMKSWRYTLAHLGFMRIKYEKLKHLHCLIFRKCLYPEITERWIKMHQKDGLSCNCLNIPQDFNQKNTDSISVNKVACDKALFLELPFM